MAPFKLFRMSNGNNSRSTSQETDESTSAILPHQQPPVSNLIMATNGKFFNGSSTTIDSEYNSENSLMSINDQRALLHNHQSTNRVGEQIGYSNPNLTNSEIPLSPPPSYDSVIEENRLLALDKENNQTAIAHSISFSLSQAGICDNNNMLGEMDHCDLEDDHAQNNCSSQENLIDHYPENIPIIDSPSCSCDQFYENGVCSDEAVEDYNMDNESNHDNCQELLLDSSDPHERCSLQSSLHANDEDYDNYDEDQQYVYAAEDLPENNQHMQQYIPEIKGPEILYKSSKELYKAVAKQSGITCKMSDKCRCFDCQSHYFDCDYDQNENEKTDGGLGAGTPVFINVLNTGSACTIL